jgi:hypothetical protein
MLFMLAKDGWSVSFLEEDCTTSLPLHLVFQSELKILDMDHSKTLKPDSLEVGDQFVQCLLDL